MSDATQRIGDVERAGAVEALKVHLAAGRITSAEYEERTLAVRQARTRGDLEPLFGDLPAPTSLAPAEVPLRTATQTPPTPTGVAATAAQVPQHHGLVPEPYAAWVMSLTPFAALILFFATDYHWQWFLAIPIVGLIVYGPKGRDGHHH